MAFANAYPRKWLLYDTKIKDVTFKFYIDNKKAQVLLDIEPKEEEKSSPELKVNEVDVTKFADFSSLGYESYEYYPGAYAFPN